MIFNKYPTNQLNAKTSNSSFSAQEEKPPYALDKANHDISGNISTAMPPMPEHNNKKQKLPYMTLTILGGILITVFAYDIVWHLFLSFLHILVICLHATFEFCEHQLDLLIEHTFHTSPRTTEIIVFYLMASALAFIAYKLIKAMPRWYCKSCERVIGELLEEKAWLAETWHQQPLANKLKWVATIATGSYLILVMTGGSPF